MSDPTVLYHYSPLVHLPPIIRVGLAHGEIAHPNPMVRLTAVSLTTQYDPDRLNCWANAGPDPVKTAVWYVCRLPAGDTRLEPARAAWKRLGVSPRAVKGLDPYGQSKWWSFYHGAIPPAWFTVELRGRHGYVPVTGADLASAVAEVAVVRDRFEFVVPPEMPWGLAAVLKDESDQSPLWLLEEGYPADQLLSRRPAV